MRISSFVPDVRIRNFVHRIDAVEASDDENSPVCIPFYADGYPGIIFQSTRGGVFSLEPRKKLSQFFVYGQTICPVSLELSAGTTMLIFYLYPHVCHAIFGFDADEIIDTCLDLTLLPEARILPLLDQLTLARTAESRINLITGYLSDTIHKHNIAPDRTIQYAVQHIILSGGTRPVHEIRQEVNSTQRTFERRFLRHVGVSPKLFSRIVQFQATLQTLNARKFSKLSDVAYDHGYSDQSHFTRSFRQFTGKSPERFTSG